MLPRMLGRARFGGVVVGLWFGLSAACSSSDFSGPAAEQDAGSVDSAATSDAGLDTGTTASDGGAVDAGCPALGASPDTVYVDGRAAAGGNGTATCPAKTIREGLSIIAGLASARRTLKVAGGTSTAPLVYEETAALVVKAQTTVDGDGVERVEVKGGGACAVAAQGCVFNLEGGASVQGLTIRPGARVGLALTPGILTGATAKNLLVTGATSLTNHAVLLKGAGGVELGPGFRAVGNEGAGVYVEEIFSLKVAAGGSNPNQFNENAGGIVMMRGTLNFDSGEVSKNRAAGVSLVSTPKHSVSNLVARDNGGPGIFLEAGAGLVLRNSTIVKNRVGIVAKFGALVDIDLGNSLGAGNNVLAGAEKNNKAAICFPTARNVKVNALGNKWSSCPPPAATLGGATCETLGAYQDIYYAPSVETAPPIDTSGCTPG